MPLRDYICPECDTVNEEIVKNPAPDTLPCRQCSSLAKLDEDPTAPVDTGWRYPAPSKRYLDAT